MVATTKKAGRPKKVVAAGSSKIEVTLPDDVIAYARAQAALRGREYLGTFLKDAIYVHADLVPRLEQAEANMSEMRDMFEEMKSMLRIMTTFAGDQGRIIEELRRQLADRNGTAIDSGRYALPADEDFGE